MGIEIAVTRIEGKPVVEIPETAVKFKVKYEPEEKPISREFITKSGGRNRVMTKIGWDKETRLKPGKPILMAFKNPGRPWSYIKGGVPINEPNFWYETVDQYYYRAEIDAPYVRDYKILPGAEISLIFKTMITLPVYYITVNHLGIDYEAEWDARTKAYQWYITPKNTCYDAVDKALAGNLTPYADVDPIGDIINIDIFFSNNEGKRLSRLTGYAYRNMSVRNYSATVELDYPFLCEIRATYLSSCSRKNYNNMLLIDALKTTVENIVNFWFQTKGEGSHIKHAQNLKAIEYSTAPIQLSDFPEYAVTDGQEIQRRVSFDEVGGFPFYFCDIYVRIVNENTHSRLDKSEYEYSNFEINRDLNGKRLPDGSVLTVDKYGFLWLRR